MYGGCASAVLAKAENVVSWAMTHASHITPVVEAGPRGGGDLSPAIQSSRMRSLRRHRRSTRHRPQLQSSARSRPSKTT